MSQLTESDFQTFETVGALVVVLDVDGRIVYWNRSLLRPDRLLARRGPRPHPLGLRLDRGGDGAV